METRSGEVSYRIINTVPGPHFLAHKIINKPVLPSPRVASVSLKMQCVRNVGALGRAYPMDLKLMLWFSFKIVQKLMQYLFQHKSY